jgi:hypothetical protein
MMPNQAQPAPTPAPIHDIADAVWFFPYPLWMVAAAAAALIALVALVVFLFRKLRAAKPLTPREKALAALAELRRLGPDAGPYAFGIQVSDALRTYIRDQHGLDAVTRTSLEFLETLQGNLVFTTNEKAAISEFLESADLLKYARLEAGAEEISALLDIAERVVRGEQSQPVPAQ